MDGTPDLDRFSSRRSTAYGRNGLVATSQPLAAEAGLEILRSGGNAFDAAVATAAVLNVVEPTSTGLGGDVFGLYRTAGGEVGAIRSCGGAPADATRANVRERLAAESGLDPDTTSMPLRGAQTVTVPGTARGWEATVERLGSLSLSTVLEPAIRYARDGFVVTPFISQKWRHGDALFDDEYARRVFLPGGKTPHTGDVVTLPDLGDTIERIATEGADALYEGPIGERIVAAVRDGGGFLSMDDLKRFEPEFVDPVTTSYGGVDVYELPPNNQGLIVLEALNIAAEVRSDDAADSPIRVHQLVEAMKLAFHDGHRYITDPEYEDVPALGSKSYAKLRASSITDTALRDVDVGVPNGASAEDADTVLLTVADAEGNVVSYINSLFKGFGSGLVAPGTGIALQNRGSSFSLDPSHPNRLEPNKRPFHTLIPALARLGPGDWMAFGVMGGFMQPQGHLQVLTNVIDRGTTLQAALDEPRWRYRSDGTLAVEARFDESVVSELVRRGHDVRIMSPEAFGGGQIARNDGQTLSGGTDPRKDGAVAVW
ncbi:gamma-glutamyltransferase family protein [Halobellus sp. Atlit-31R]|nr:gamma-glutamyltransferase family protein [Halobellus sp. Atlit-31R]